MKHVVIFIILILNCATHDDLSFELEDNNTNLLKLNGYYYYQRPNDRYINIFYLYKNGIVFGNDCLFNKMNNQEIESALLDGSWEKQERDNSEHWGIYHIVGSEIQFNRLYWTESGTRSIVKKGNILNDTTIYMPATKVYYYFKAFTYKPDSTNNFVK